MVSFQCIACMRNVAYLQTSQLMHALQVAERSHLLRSLLQLLSEGAGLACAAATALLNLASHQAVASSLISQPGCMECMTTAIAGEDALVASHSAGASRALSSECIACKLPGHSLMHGRCAVSQ